MDNSNKNTKEDKGKILSQKDKKQIKNMISLILWTLLIFSLIVIIAGRNVKYGEKEKYTIDFYSNGEQIKEVVIEAGELVERPDDPVKEGVEFSHWATHEKTVDGSEVFDFSKAPTKSIGLFAHFKAKSVPESELESQPNDSNSNDNQTSYYGYEKIYNEYADRLKKECPTLAMMECAELANEGIVKMADYMFKAHGIEGQYATYEKWASKLINVYTQEAR